MENLLKDIDWKRILWDVLVIALCALFFYMMIKFEWGYFNPKYEYLEGDH